jgi:hypothetical protein
MRAKRCHVPGDAGVAGCAICIGLERTVANAFCGLYPTQPKRSRMPGTSRCRPPHRIAMRRESRLRIPCGGSARTPGRLADLLPVLAGLAFSIPPVWCRDVGRNWSAVTRRPSGRDRRRWTSPRGSNQAARCPVPEYGGESGIRTHGRFDPSPVFKTGALNRSAISPFDSGLRSGRVRRGDRGPAGRA